MKELNLLINVEPLPHKETLFGGGRAYTDPRKREYILKILEELSGWDYQFYFLGDKALEVHFDFSFKANVISKRYRTKSPDLDNLEKTLQDCLQGKRILKNGKKDILGLGIIDDDSRICKKVSEKFDVPGPGYIKIYIRAITAMEMLK